MVRDIRDADYEGVSRVVVIDEESTSAPSAAPCAALPTRPLTRRPPYNVFSFFFLTGCTDDKDVDTEFFAELGVKNQVNDNYANDAARAWAKVAALKLYKVRPCALGAMVARSLALMPCCPLPIAPLPDPPPRPHP